MSPATLSLLKGVIIMMAIMLLAYFLKRNGFFKKEYSGLFSQLVLKITLPALIISSLAMNEFNLGYIKMAGFMAMIEILIMLLAYLIARLLKFDHAKTGALILVSAFGMTTMLGYPLIAQMYPGNAEAMEEAVVTSEFGVGFLLFVLGPLIAMYFGSKTIEVATLKKSLKTFLSSPIFISLLLGVGLSVLPIDKETEIFKTFLAIFHQIGQANLFLVAITIGLILEFKRFGNVFIFIGIVIVLKLFLKPLLSIWLTQHQDFTATMDQIVFIETAMPSAILTAVFSKQYNCKPELVSISIMVTLLISVLTIPGLFGLFY